MTHTFTVLATQPFLCPRCGAAWVLVKAEAGRDHAYGMGGKAGNGTPQFSWNETYRCCAGVTFTFKLETKGEKTVESV